MSTNLSHWGAWNLCFTSSGFSTIDVSEDVDYHVNVICRVLSQYDRITVVQLVREIHNTQNSGEGPPWTRDDRPKGGVAAVELHQTTRTPALEVRCLLLRGDRGRISRRRSKSTTLGVVAHLYTEHLADPTWVDTQVDHKRLFKTIVSRWGCSLGSKTPWFYSRSARTSYTSPH